jgi:hypothetical protein
MVRANVAGRISSRGHAAVHASSGPDARRLQAIVIMVRRRQATVFM